MLTFLIAGSQYKEFIICRDDDNSDLLKLGDTYIFSYSGLDLQKEECRILHFLSVFYSSVEI